MQFISLKFAFFFCIVISTYWGLKLYPKLQKGFLLLASYTFYTLPFYETAGFKPLSLLLLSTSLAYTCGELLTISNKKNKYLALMLGIFCQLGILGIHKYFSFFRLSLLEFCQFFGVQVHIPIFKIIFPIGISFYCFQAVSYLVDLYRGTGKRADNFLDFALFQAFFPKLLIGPICKSQELLPQIENPQPKPINLHIAVLFLFSGLIKKALIATYFFEYGVHDPFQDPEGYATSTLWISICAYSAQLYCDFSGYTDLAIATALILGFQLPNNFAAPYAAKNLGAFWQKWHITFGRWLKEYIYFPLGGSRVSPNRVSLNLFLTFLFCGLWHGASWGYIFWGGMHGVGLAIHKRNRDRKRARGLDPNHYPTFVHTFFAWFYTFMFVTLSRIFFQVPDLERTQLFFKRMFGMYEGLEAHPIHLYLIALVLFMNFYGKNIFESCTRLLLRITHLHKIISFALMTSIMILGLYAVFFLMPSGIPPYLYYRF